MKHYNILKDKEIVHTTATTDWPLTSAPAYSLALGQLRIEFMDGFTTTASMICRFVNTASPPCLEAYRSFFSPTKINNAAEFNVAGDGEFLIVIMF